MVGRVFWAGAVAAIGGRERAEAEAALHDLGRRALVRRVRASSVAGEVEYTFAHALVRDVAYAQIPRAERARRHVAAAAWIDRMAADRREGVAELVAYHLRSALELDRQAGRSVPPETLTAARGAFALAAAHALGLDVARAEAWLGEALALAPADDRERPELLLRWSAAVYRLRRNAEAISAAEEALAAWRARDDLDGVARALILLCELAFHAGDARYVALAEDALAALDGLPSGSTLVAALESHATTMLMAGRGREAIASADRALAVAAELGMPVPALALGTRGEARANLGDLDGFAEMERAIGLLAGRGVATEAAQLMNNLANRRYAVEARARRSRQSTRRPRTPPRTATRT